MAARGVRRKAYPVQAEKLAANGAEIYRSLFGQIVPAVGTDGRSGKMYERLVAEPAEGRKNGTTHSIQRTSKNTRNSAPSSHLRWRKTTGSI
jgi:hypothetical protein